MTPAAIRVQDVPGTGPALLGNLRQVDALLVVLDGFSPGADPAGDLENLKLELLVADRDHVAGRLERVEKQAKSGDPKLRAEVERLREVLAAVDARHAALRASTGELPDGLEPLTTKPLIAVENGPGGIDLALEAELAELSDEEAAAFRDGGASALEEVVRRLRDALDLVTFFTAGEKETRAWTLRRGRDRARRRGDDPLRHRARLHPLRGDRLEGSRRGRLPRRGLPPRPPAARGEDLRGPRRRRAEHPLQRLS